MLSVTRSIFLGFAFGRPRPSRLSRHTFYPRRDLSSSLGGLNGTSTSDRAIRRDIEGRESGHAWK